MDDLKYELELKFKSIFSVEEMAGTITDRNRHVKIELWDEKEYENLLNSGKLNVQGNLFDVDKFLPSPKILICAKCNLPGHTRKMCQVSNFDVCKRCGGDRKNLEEHKNCQIKCHNCQGDHVSTDFKCPIIKEFRRHLIIEMRKHPERLPPDTQLFIPSDFRQQNDRTKSIQSLKSNAPVRLVEPPSDRNDWNAYPALRSTSASAFVSSNSIASSNLSDTIKTMSNELNEIKTKYEIEQKRIQEKYQEHLTLMNQGWILIQQEIQTQKQMIMTLSNIVEQIMFSTCEKT
ncbi:unnamed protein product, partial [Didymodactylos carnosus]